MQLGQLAAERNASSSTAGASKIAKRLKDAATRLIDHGCTLIGGDRTKDAAPIHAASRKESLKTPSRAGNARGDKGGKEGGGSRDRNHPNAGGDRRADKVLAWIANEWRSSIADQRQCITSLQTLNERQRPLHLIKSWERD
jgi:hypothetical protein